MSRRCQLTGKSNNSANTVSHSNRRVKTVQKANVFKKRIYIPSQDRWVRIKVSASALRTLEKVGVDEFLKRNNIKL